MTPLGFRWEDWEREVELSPSYFCLCFFKDER